MHRTWITGSLAVAALLAAQGGLAAQDTVAPRFPPRVEAAAARIFNSTMSPFCPGLLLSNCPSPQAGILRDTIRARLAAGVPPDAIRDALLATYGDQVRASPPARGFGLLAWVIPGVGLVLAALAVVWWLRRTTRAAAPPGGPPPALEPEAQARLEHELSQL
jgi:cytochrome c-type biogenesis protein CcmH